MRATKYEFKKAPVKSGAQASEFVNGTLSKLNEEEPVGGNGITPHWELADGTTVLPDGEVLFCFTRWEQ